VEEVPNTPAETTDPVAELATGILIDLYRAVCGHEPKAVRAYHDADALLLLLRFDPDVMTDRPVDGFEPLLDTAFMAMPGMIASAIEARGGQHLAPGNLSVCAERGLAVFAFSSALAEVEVETGNPFDLETPPPGGGSGRPRLRLAS
jgi:hypothetical protein